MPRALQYWWWRTKHPMHLEPSEVERLSPQTIEELLTVHDLSRQIVPAGAPDA